MALTDEWYNAVNSGWESTSVWKFSRRWLPGSSLDATTSLLVFVAETAMK